jgi:hypothetical protein
MAKAKIGKGSSIVLKVGDRKSSEWVDGVVQAVTSKGYSIRTYWGGIYCQCPARCVKRR